MIYQQTNKNLEDSFMPDKQSVPFQAPASSPGKSLMPKTGKGGKSGSAMPVIIAIIVIVLLVGAGAAAYFFYFKDKMSGGKMNPEQVITKMMDSMKEVKTVEEKMEFELNFEVNEQDGDAPEFAALFSKGKMTGTIEGKSDETDKKNPKVDISMNIGVEIAMFPFDLGIQLRTLSQEEIYFKISEIPAMLALMAPADFSSLQDNWIQVNFETLKQEYKDNPEVLEMLSGYSSSMSEEEIEEIEKIFYKPQLFVVKKDLGSKKVNGVDTYHYAVGFDYDQLEQMAFELINYFAEKSEGDMDEEELAKMREEFTKSFSELKEGIEKLEGELWIGKKDFLLYKYVFYGEGDIEEGEMSITASLKGESKNFNKPVEITAPAEFKTIQDVIKELEASNPYSGMMPIDDGTTPPEPTDSDGDGLSDAEEVIYGTEIFNPDTDGDGYSDGDEVKNGFNPNGPGQLE